MFAHVSALGMAVFPVYLLLTVVIGWVSRRRARDANDFLNASRSLPLPIVSAAFLAANTGALGILGLTAMAAQYGVQAFHFYWVGAIPGTVFLSLWVLPVYRRSGIKSLPEYLEKRYSREVRLVNGGILGVTQLMLAGIILYAAAQVLHVLLGTSHAAGVALTGVVVLVYVLLGGLRATIYNEVFQLAVVMAGLVPLAWKTMGWAREAAKSGGIVGHLWTALPVAQRSAPMDQLGVVVGLGFVLSFSYWMTDFVLMQRALAAKTDAEARQVPLWAGFGKLLSALVVVIPGLAAMKALPGVGTAVRYDQTLPTMMAMFYGPTVMGLGLTALTASLMSGLAGKVSGFAALWTEDLYRGWLRPGQSEKHYLRMGLAASAFAMVAGMLLSGISFLFGNLMEHVQLLLALCGAPFFAVFLLGLMTKRVDARGALAGLVCGTIAGVVHWRVARYGSAMSSNFYGAMWAFGVAALVALLASKDGASEGQTGLLQFRWREPLEGEGSRMAMGLAVVLLVMCGWLNFVWR